MLVCLGILAWPLSRFERESAGYLPPDSAAAPSAQPAHLPPLSDVNPFLAVYQAGSKRVTELRMEEYLVGVVAAEMPASYAIEALKAQAVAARTYSYEKMTGSACGRGGAKVCTDSGHCQAYADEAERERNWGGDFARNEARIRQAVYETRGQIMAYEGKPIAAFFHSTSGGMTEDVEHVYGRALPYLRAVVSEGEENAPRYTATAIISAREFVKIITAENGRARLDRENLAPAIGEPVRFDSGRVDTVAIGGVIITGRRMRQLFSLNSTNFKITVDDAKGHVTFTTRGYGHGVGMSQVGAHAMAVEGDDYTKILLHYYTGVQISTIPG